MCVDYQLLLPYANGILHLLLSLARIPRIHNVDTNWCTLGTSWWTHSLTVTQSITTINTVTLAQNSLNLMSVLRKLHFHIMAKTVKADWALVMRWGAAAGSKSVRYVKVNDLIRQHEDIIGIAGIFRKDDVVSWVLPRPPCVPGWL